MKQYKALRKWLTCHTHSLERYHLFGHCAYFTAVFVEGHGFYALCAGGLLILTILIGIVGGPD